MIEPLRQLLNPNSYYVLIQEMSAELAETYSFKFDLLYEPLSEGKQKATKRIKAECNAACLKSIEHAKYVVDTIYKSEDDKFEYVQAVINMELQAASRYTKIFPVDVKE